MWVWYFLVVIFLIIGISFIRYVRVRVKPYYSKKVEEWQSLNVPEVPARHTVILIGDTGAPALDGKDIVLRILKNRIERYGEACTVVVLGDNIYPRGLPAKENRRYALSERRLLEQLKIFKDIPGRVFFLSGNHDWNKGMPGGLANVLRQQEYINRYLEKEDIFLPKNGCPGPVGIDIAENIYLIILNTQWWVQRGEVPLGKKDGCDIEDPDEVYVKLEKMVEENRHKKIVIAAHHPLYSNSAHGGRFPVKEHIFPLSALKRRFYLPLPGIGSIYPYYRKFLGPREDMSHPRYRRMRHRILQILKRHSNIIYAGGHDHNLQYFHKNGNHYLVSGAGSKATYVKRGKGAIFTHRHKGFMELKFYDNEVWLEVVEPVEGEAEIMFRQRLS